MRTITSLIIALLCAFEIVGGSSAPQGGFTFRARQSVYIVAVRGNIGDLSMSTLDLDAEKQIRNGFQKRRVFETAQSLSKADFVFLCVTEYENYTNASILSNVLVIVSTPEDFKANRSDLTKLRESALWQNSRSAKIRVKLKSVMEDFHEFALKK